MPLDSKTLLKEALWNAIKGISLATASIAASRQIGYELGGIEGAVIGLKYGSVLAFLVSTKYALKNLNLMMEHYLENYSVKRPVADFFSQYDPQ